MITGDLVIPVGVTLTNYGQLVVADGVTLTNRGTVVNGVRNGAGSVRDARLTINPGGILINDQGCQIVNYPTGKIDIDSIPPTLPPPPGWTAGEFRNNGCLNLYNLNGLVGNVIYGEFGRCCVQEDNDGPWPCGTQPEEGKPWNCLGGGSNECGGGVGPTIPATPTPAPTNPPISAAWVTITTLQTVNLNNDFLTRPDTEELEAGTWPQLPGYPNEASEGLNIKPTQSPKAVPGFNGNLTGLDTLIAFAVNPNVNFSVDSPAMHQANCFIRYKKASVINDSPVEITVTTPTCPPKGNLTQYCVKCAASGDCDISPDKATYNQAAQDCCNGVPLRIPDSSFSCAKCGSDWTSLIASWKCPTTAPCSSGPTPSGPTPSGPTPSPPKACPVLPPLPDRIKNKWLCIGGGPYIWRIVDITGTQEGDTTPAPVAGSGVDNWIKYCKTTGYNGIQLDMEAGYMYAQQGAPTSELEEALQKIKAAGLTTSITLAYRPGFGITTDFWQRLDWTNCDYIIPQLYAIPGYWNDSGQRESVPFPSQSWGKTWFNQTNSAPPCTGNVPGFPPGSGAFLNTKWCAPGGVILPGPTPDPCETNPGLKGWQDKIVQGIPLIDGSLCITPTPSPGDESSTTPSCVPICNSPPLQSDFSKPTSSSYVPSNKGYCYWAIGGDWTGLSVNTPSP